MSNSTRSLSRRGFLGGLAAATVVVVVPGMHAADQIPQRPGKSSPTPVRATKLPTSKTSNAKKATKATASFSAIVDQSLARNPYYFPGALISRGDVSPIFEKLLGLGLTVAEDQEDLYGSILADQSPLVSRLKTPVGRAFMKKLIADPTAYDRLARISWTSDGRKLLDIFLNSKDGYERFQKLKTPADLAKVSKQLAADPRTQDFGLPTGYIFTADALVKKLQELADSRDQPPVSDE